MKEQSFETLMNACGGAAFPLKLELEEREHYYIGLTTLDYFAGQALCAYLAGRNKDSRDTGHDSVAESCYDYAEAMVKEMKARHAKLNRNK